MKKLSLYIFLVLFFIITTGTLFISETKAMWFEYDALSKWENKSDNEKEFIKRVEALGGANKGFFETDTIFHMIVLPVSHMNWTFFITLACGDKKLYGIPKKSFVWVVTNTKGESITSTNCVTE